MNFYTWRRERKTPGKGGVVFVVGICNGGACYKYNKLAFPRKHATGVSEAAQVEKKGRCKQALGKL
jgi:hypothetical protein